MQGEEAELCSRLRNEYGSGVLYVPGTRARYRIQSEQLVPTYLLRRAYH
jgi:hypothetical protein